MGVITLLPAAAAAFRAEQGATFAALPPPAPTGQMKGAQVQPAIYEESIATGAFRRIGLRDLIATTREWRDGGAMGQAARGDDSAADSSPEEAELLDPASFVSPGLLSGVRSLHRFAQSLLVGFLICLTVFANQYTDSTALLLAWAPHANWARIASFVLGVLSWLGAAEQYAVFRRAVVAARTPLNLRFARAGSHTFTPTHTLASGRTSLIAWIAYTILLATVFDTMPADQRISAAAAGLKVGTAPTSQLIADSDAGKALLFVRLVCALVGWVLATWGLRGAPEVDSLLLQELTNRSRVSVVVDSSSSAEHPQATKHSGGDVSRDAMATSTAVLPAGLRDHSGSTREPTLSPA